MHDLICDVIFNSISGPKENGNSIMNSDNDQMNLAYALFAIMVRVVTVRLSTGRIRSLFWPVHGEPFIQPWLLHHISLFICTVSIVKRNEGRALLWTKSRVQRISPNLAVLPQSISPRQFFLNVYQSPLGNRKFRCHANSHIRWTLSQSMIRYIL